MSEKQISLAEQRLNADITGFRGEHIHLYFYALKMIKPERIRVDIPAGHICLLTVETGAFIHRWNDRNRWIAKSLTDIFYGTDDQCVLEFPESGSYSFYLMEINADALKPHQAIHAGLQSLVTGVTTKNSVCLNLLPLVMDFEGRTILEDLRFFEGKPVPVGLVDAQCLLLFIRVLEKLIRLGLKDGIEWLPDYDGENLERAAADISAEPGQKISIPELAKRYGISPGRLKSLFKQQFGLTVRQFISKVRMDRASDLIMHTRLPVREIADRVGYSNNSTFSASFKKKTGFSPAKLRKRSTV